MLQGYNGDAAFRRAPRVAMNPCRRPPADRSGPAASRRGARQRLARAGQWLALGAGLLSIFCAACAADTGPGAPAAGGGTAGVASAAGAIALDAENPMAALRALVGDAACESDADCRSMPIGAKACGGPEGYVAWSRRVGDAAALAEAVAAYNARRAADTQRDGRVSDCAMAVDPGAACLPTGASGAATRHCQSLPPRTGAGSSAR